MQGELWVDLDGLRRYAARLADLGDHVESTRAALGDALARANGCWGDDDLGANFAKDFTPHSTQLVADIQAMARGLHEMAAQVGDAAGQFESADHSGGQRVRDNLADEPAGPTGPNEPAWPTEPSAGSPAPGTVTPMGSRTPAGTAATPTAAGSTPDAAGIPASANGRGAQAPRDADTAPGAGTPRGGRTPWQPDSEQQNPAASRGTPPAATSPTSEAGNPAARRNGADRRARPPISAMRSDRPPSDRPPSATPASTPWAPQRSSPSSQSSDGQQRPSGPRPPSNRQRQKEEKRPERRPGGSDALAQLARMLAERHHVEVLGFELPELDELAVGEFALAVDDVLTRHPITDLGTVAVADLHTDAEPPEEPRIVLWSRDPDTTPQQSSIVLDLRAAKGSSQSSGSTAEFDDRPIYAATAREFGRALDAASDGAARAAAQRVLIRAYLELVARPAGTDLAEVVGGYKQWRSQLPGALVTGVFDPGAALRHGFADVMLHGDSASVPAQVLHALLVAAARREG